MQWSDVRRPVTAKTAQQFGFLLALLTLMVSVNVSWKHGVTGFALVLAGLSAGLALLAWANPLVYRTVFSVWMVLVFPVGWTVSRLILAMVYFTILTPIGLFLRWRGYDPLSLKDAAKGTYWETKDPAVPARRYLRQY